jgi:hypothetical protein
VLYRRHINEKIISSGGIHGQGAVHDLSKDLKHIDSKIILALNDRNITPNIPQVTQREIFDPESNFNKLGSQFPIEEEMIKQMDEWDEKLRCREENTMILKELHQFKARVDARFGRFGKYL